jgi:hypothetical protein
VAAKIAVHARTVFVNVNTVGVVMLVINQAVKRLIMAMFVANPFKVFATKEKDNVYVLLVSVASTVMPKFAKRILTMAWHVVVKVVVNVWMMVRVCVLQNSPDLHANYSSAWKETLVLVRVVRQVANATMVHACAEICITVIVVNSNNAQHLWKELIVVTMVCATQKVHQVVPVHVKLGGLVPAAAI